jgi:hypothetical protein
MILDRRTFIQSAALVATTSAAAVLLPLSSTAQSQDSQITGPAPALVDDGTDRSLVVFRIDGWDRCGGDDLSVRSSNTVATVSTSNEVVIKIDHSWRTAWR